MASPRASRLLVAAGLAIAIAVGPAAVALGGQSAAVPSRTIADPASCLNSGSSHSPSLACVPGSTVDPGGLPSESQLTQDNSGHHH